MNINDKNKMPREIWAWDCSGLDNGAYTSVKHIAKERSPYSEKYHHDDVVREKDRRIAEIEGALDIYEEAIYKLACLGNGIRFGNSDGNIIAQRSIAKVKQSLKEITSKASKINGLAPKSSQEEISPINKAKQALEKGNDND